MNLNNTYPHKEEVNKNKTIRVGTTVPKGAVNLAYYYNNKSSLDNTISVIETDSNVLRLIYKESWRHERDLPRKSEDFFPDTIIYNGEKGTDEEDYYGVLYRDFIDWEEATIADLTPAKHEIYKKIDGITKNRLPRYINYNDGDVFGKLKISASFYEETHFKISPYPSFEYFPRRWRVAAMWGGLVYKNKINYHGTARYSGVISKKDGLANVDPDEPREVIMFPDEDGVLKTENGKELLSDNLFYITDKFKDNIPLYYMHKLKNRIYDNVGPNKFGVFESNKIKLLTASGNSINENKYKYKVHLEPTIWENIYDVFIYTSFIPSVEKPIYAIYDGLPEDAYNTPGAVINPFDVNVNIKEKISVIQAYDTDKYEVVENYGDTLQSYIKLKDFERIKDDRKKVQIGYFIEVQGLDGEEILKTPIIETYIINKKYALYSEMDNYINQQMIISEKDANGFMTAKDMIKKHVPTKYHYLLEKDNIAYKIRFGMNDNINGINKDKVVLSTNEDGSSYIFALTFEDTGFIGQDIDEDGNFINNVRFDDYSVYRSKDGVIVKGFKVCCRNINKITVAAPRDNDPLKGWFPLVKFSYFHKYYEKTDGALKIIYTVPEYNYQDYGIYGKPYIDIKDEEPSIINKNSIKLSKTPLYVKTDNFWNPINIRVKKMLFDGTVKELEIESFNYKQGIIDLKDSVIENDNIFVDYTYEEQFYSYRGYYEDNNFNSKMIDINLNPNMYCHYTDTTTEFYENKNSYNLFNSTIHFFLRPKRVVDMKSGEILEDNLFSIYHRVNTQESISPFDLHIGKIFVRHHASLKSTELIDTRTRGGGIIEEMSNDLRRSLEPESDFYLDIGTIDGIPYHENSVIIVKLDNKLLKINGGKYTEDEIKERVSKWAAYGMYPIIEYVKVIHDEDMPNSTMVVNKHIDNQKHIKPCFECEIID